MTVTSWNWSQTQGQQLIIPYSMFDRQVLLVGEERCFIQEAGNLGRWQTGVPQTTSELLIRASGFKGKHQGFAGSGYMQSSTVSSNQHPEFGGAGSGEHHFIWSEVNLQLQGWVVFIFLRPDFGSVPHGAAYVIATVWSSCS